jgi:hypothetical protein
VSHTDKARKPQGHRVTYVMNLDDAGAFRSMAARCGCGWHYTNSVKSDVRDQARWHRNATVRRP